MAIDTLLVHVGISGDVTGSEVERATRLEQTELTADTAEIERDAAVLT